MVASVSYLTEEEIDQFITELDTDKDGLVEYHEVEQKLDDVYKELGE